MRKNQQMKWLFFSCYLLLGSSYAIALPRHSVSSFSGILQQERIISGRITANNGTPLPGVTIKVKGTARGATSNDNGYYTINLPKDDVTLVFTSIGFNSQEIDVADQTTISIVMQAAQSEELSEIVVIGYGTAKKSDLTGSVSSVKAEELQAIPATSIDQALQGRAAGVQVTQVSGQPGGQTSIRIRGTSSINAGNEPLYVIDGMLVNSEGIGAGTNRSPSINPLSAINPNDIESIEILKDASASAIYGSRGANGVILITTKKGKEGTSAINFESYYGMQRISNKVEVLNAAQFADLVNEAQLNANATPVYVNPQNLGEGTNWQDEILRDAPMATYQASLSGGDAKTQYALSGGYFSQKGIIANSDYDRYSFRANLNRQLTERLAVGTNFTYSRLATSGVLTNLGTLLPGITTSALLFNPVQPIYDPNGPGGYTFEDDRGRGLSNPVADREMETVSQSSRILGNAFANFKIIEGLEFKTSFGIDQYFTKENSFVPNFLKRAHSSEGEVGIGNSQALTWLNENTITYNKTINTKHQLNIVAGNMIQKFFQENSNMLSFGFSDNRTGYHDIRSGLNHQPPANGESSWSMVSYLSRINYTLDDKYLFTLSGRMDGSSKFGSENKYGFFPSGAFAWRLSDETFMQNVNVFNDLKVRTSYGLIGNQAIAPYQSIPLVGPFGEGVFNSSQGSEVYKGKEPLNYANNRLKWESTQQLDIGLDASLFQSRVTITADYYHKKTTDLLLSTPIPSTSGFITSILNIGNVENKGFDLDIRTVNTTGKLNWNTAINFSVNRNQVTRLNSDDDILQGGFAPGWSILRVGEPIGSFYGYIFDGIFQTDEEAASSAVLRGQEASSPNPASRARAGDRRYRDINDDGVIDENDRTLIGNAQADFTWGINNSFTYKNIDFSFFFQGSQGNQLANFNSFELQNFNGEQNALAEAALNRWTPDNPSNLYPRALASGSLDVNTFSSTIVEDASYIRLRNIVLGYTLPENLLRNLRMKSLRVYVSGTNLFTWTKYKGYDPEVNFYGQSTTFIGADYGSYPMAKTLLFGLNIGF
ncbi:TonB-dependent receptor [Olivibacter sp. SDN3]|uniref:SusC/RagA family TonB-linked outer membrane protein n=1 Tax=Olivibacter sp. SDN3 TaxID=2764720 RepID=UPI0016517C80|nr:TonB-dependent receptor [Olivibacter sp. SDN3]QNL51742.1 TonB-dependent receptor [Olivibacter sp. SDN3]